jgi:hypothetical protein
MALMALLTSLSRPLLHLPRAAHFLCVMLILSALCVSLIEFPDPVMLWQSGI